VYSWIWRHLPGPAWLRFFEALALLFAAVAVLFAWVYPWVADTFPAFDNTVG